MTAAHTILLVEDDPNDILLTERAFHKANLQTYASLQIVTDGDAAVDYLSGMGDYANRDRYPLPTFILLDLKLPRRSGHEILAWLREQPELKRLPVVVLTSSKQITDINQAYDLGANSYLVKPVGLAPLVEVIQSLNLYWLLLNEKPELQHY